MILTNFILSSPDYNSSVSIRYAWQTSIKRSILGYESRTKLKSWPRRSIAWKSQVPSSYNRNLLIRKMFFDFSNVFGVPLWPYQTYLTQQASIDDTIIYCNTDNLNFAIGQIILITSDFIDYDFGEIESFDSTSITLTSVLVSDFIAGASVFPVLQARVANTSNITFEQLTSRIGYIDFDFMEAYEDGQTYQVTSDSLPTYNGYSVFNIEPNWSSSQSLSITKPFEVKYNIGIDTAISYQTNSDFAIVCKYMLNSHATTREIEKFFNIMSGRYGSFWIPSWGDDFVITSEVINTDTILKIENINYLDNWLTSDLVGRIIFIKSKGLEVYKMIIGAPNSDEITLDSAVGIDILESELKTTISCFLLPVRFDMDEIELEFTSDKISDVELKFYTLNDSNMIPT